MNEKSNFIYQNTLYSSKCLPCTRETFNRIIDDPQVASKIALRQAIENAVEQGLPLDDFSRLADFQKFCRKKKLDSFAQLTLGEKLQQWAKSIKTSLPCFAFSVNEFATTTTEDEDGQSQTDKRRKQENIAALSNLFMFDGDHSFIAPQLIYERTRVEGFPWEVALAHATSSGHGLRLVCKARPELGNIADNQICLARDLELLGVMGTTGKPVCDNSCINANRVSFCPRREDILYINEKLLFEPEEPIVDDGVTYTCEFDRKFRKAYQVIGTQPTNPDNHFDARPTSAPQAPTVSSPEAATKLAHQVASPLDSKALTLTEEQLEERLKVFDVHVAEVVKTMYPEGVPAGSRHNAALRLAGDLMIVLDGDEKVVKHALLQLTWVREIIVERGEKEIDDIISAAKNLLKKREAEHFGDLRPSREMQAALKTLTKRTYKQLMQLTRAKLGGDDGAADININDVLERMGDVIQKRFFRHYPLLKLACHGLQKKHYAAGLFVMGAFCMDLTTRMWYQFWPSPGKRCRMNHLLELIGRQGSGKRFAVDLYEIMLDPVRMADAVQIAALNRWKEERAQKNGSAQNQTPEPKGIYRCLPSEASAAAVRDAEVNAHETIDGEDWPLHICQFDSELQNTLSQLKKSYFSQLYTLWLKGFHNEPHGAFLKSATSIVGEWPVFFNVVYTGTKHALDQQVSASNYETGLSSRITAVPMGSTGFEMMKNRTFGKGDAVRNEQLREWAYRLDATKGEIPCRPISDALYAWTERRMEDARENQSLAEEDILKRPCWHAINYALPFIVARHWDQMVQDADGRWKCGPDFKTDKTDRDLALFLAQAQLTFQRYFFGAIAEQHYEEQQINASSRTQHQHKTLKAYRQLPEVFASDDVDRCYGYNASKGSICSRLKRLVDDGLAVKIRTGEDRGKYRKVQ